MYRDLNSTIRGYEFIKRKRNFLAAEIGLISTNFPKFRLKKTMLGKRIFHEIINRIYFKVSVATGKNQVAGFYLHEAS